MKKIGFVPALALTVFSLAPAAFADMSGIYEVLQNDCAKFTLTEGLKAEVRASKQGLAVGMNHVYTSGKSYFSPAFEFETGEVRKGCLGTCYSIYEGTYSASGNRFRERVYFARFQDSKPELRSEIEFVLKGNELRIDDGANVCVLKKVSR